jgi:hypothetical protein
MFRIFKRKYKISVDNDDIIDPPMPPMGANFDFEIMKTRNRRAEAGMQALMELVEKDSNIAVVDAENIPVEKHNYHRIQVTEEMSKSMSKVKNEKQINSRVLSNMREIQKALNYRKSALIMMNANYSKKLVCKIEPIVVNETRSAIEFH